MYLVSLMLTKASSNTKTAFAPITIGFTIGFLGLIGGTVSGGAFVLKLLIFRTLQGHLVLHS
jgi:glycerol uptake facilitator-like aquaporin